jgi:hypothetical protein
MTSEKKNEIGANDSNGRVLKIRETAALTLKELDQLRSTHRCVLHMRGVGRITAPDSFFLREKIAARPMRNVTGKIVVELTSGRPTI